MDGRFEMVDDHFEKIENHLSYHNEMFSILLDYISSFILVLESILTSLMKARIIEIEEYLRLHSTIINVHFNTMKKVMEAKSKKPNPIRRNPLCDDPVTDEEFDRLEKYLEKMQKLEKFTWDEAVDLHNIAHKYLREFPGEPAGLLITLSAMINAMVDNPNFQIKT